MTYIALDLWDKRVGIAYSDMWIAFPREIVKRVDIVSYLKKMLAEHTNIEVVVVGLPYDLYGKDTKQLDKTQKFIEKLRDIFPDYQIVGHDERFSSFEASRDFNDHRDDVAAACILQSYLDTK